MLFSKIIYIFDLETHNMNKSKQDEVTKLFNTKEDLHPELKKYYFISDSGIPMIKHPLVFSIFHNEVMNHMMNKHYEYKVSEIKKAILILDYAKFIFLHERPYRLNAFMSIHKLLSDKEYWECLGEIWTDSENIWQNKSSWKILLNSKRPLREHFMDEDDRAAFKNLPEKITIYRGYHPSKNKNGFSYTLNKTKAIWFSNRFQSTGVIGEVKERTINKKDCFAYMGGRNESEIITIK